MTYTDTHAATINPKRHAAYLIVREKHPQAACYRNRRGNAPTRQILADGPGSLVLASEPLDESKDNTDVWCAAAARVQAK